MSLIISSIIVFAISLIAFKLLLANNAYEKISGFYFAFTNFICLILIVAIADFQAMLDIIIVLFLLQFVAVLFLLHNLRK